VRESAVGGGLWNKKGGGLWNKKGGGLWNKEGRRPLEQRRAEASGTKKDPNR